MAAEERDVETPAPLELAEEEGPLRYEALRDDAGGGPLAYELPFDAAWPLPPLPLLLLI